MSAQGGLLYSFILFLAFDDDENGLWIEVMVSNFSSPMYARKCFYCDKYKHTKGGAINRENGKDRFACSLCKDENCAPPAKKNVESAQLLCYNAPSQKQKRGTKNGKDTTE